LVVNQTLFATIPGNQFNEIVEPRMECWLVQTRKHKACFGHGSDESEQRDKRLLGYQLRLGDCPVVDDAERASQIAIVYDIGGDQIQKDTRIQSELFLVAELE
jgi:hypothetical protein